MTPCAAWVPEWEQHCPLSAANPTEVGWLCVEHFLGWLRGYRPSAATLTAALDARLPSAGSPPTAGAGLDPPPPLGPLDRWERPPGPSGQAGRGLEGGQVVPTDHPDPTDPLGRQATAADVAPQTDGRHLQLGRGLRERQQGVSVHGASVAHSVRRITRYATCGLTAHGVDYTR